MAETPTPKRESKITMRRRAFVRAYVAGPPGVRGNATKAAIHAGYSAKTAGEQASRLLANVRIRAEVERALDKRDLTSERILDELEAVGFSSITDFVTWTDTGVTLKPSAELAHAAPISEVSEHVTEAGRAVKIKFHDKLAALRDIAKIRGILRERHEHSGPNGGPISTVLIDPAKCTDEELDRLEAIQSRLAGTAK